MIINWPHILSKKAKSYDGHGNFKNVTVIVTIDADFDILIIIILIITLVNQMKNLLIS